MSAAPSVRQRFGRYEVLFPIATGGMAEVFAARSIGEAGFSKLVALKRMRPELTEDVRFTTMFLDEGRMAANIASPNVVSTLDLGRADDNSLFLVMELVTGASLAAVLRETTLRSAQFPPGVAVEILCQAANGLHDAHEARSPAGEPLGIIHRDVSPHNVLVDVNGQAKITDFGIAKALERQTQSHAGEMKGKLSYLSPEQARGRDVDRRTDIFILGIVAWEVLVGRRLFTGRGPVEVLHKIATMDVPRVNEIRPELPAAIGDVVAQALARDRDERFRSALAFGNALGHAFGRRLPPRSEVAAFVREFGGDALRDLEQGIRRAAGGSFDELPAASDPEYPIPLTARSAPAAPLKPDTIPDEPPDGGTVPMSPLDLPEEVRRSLSPAAPSLAAPKVPSGDLGLTIRADTLTADQLDLDAPRGFPETLPTLEGKLETYRPPPPAMHFEDDVPAPPTGGFALRVTLGAAALILLIGGGALLFMLGGRGDVADATATVPPVAVEPAVSGPTSEPVAPPDAPPEPVSPEEVRGADTEARSGTERSSGRPPRGGRRAAPRGDPPPRLPGQADPVGDRQSAMREIFGSD